AAAARVYDLRRIHPRRSVNLTFDRATHALEAVRYQIDGRTLLVLEAREDGTIAARRELLPYFVEVKGVAGRIERGLREDAVESGVPARIVSDLADIFGWDVDVAGDLRPGDEFRVVYEDIWQTGGARPEPGNVLGAEIVSRGRATTAVFFEDADGNGGYYRPNGEALSRTFLHYALDRDGEYVDPLALTGAIEQPVPASARRAFERVQAEMTRELAALPETAHPFTVTLSHRGPGPE